MTDAEIASRLTHRLGLSGRVYDLPPPHSDLEEALVSWLKADAEHCAQATAWLAHPTSPPCDTEGLFLRSWASRELELRRPIMEALGIEVPDNEIRGFTRLLRPRPIRKLIRSMRR